jgi:thiol:disulfide interchange protein DsbD
VKHSRIVLGLFACLAAVSAAAAPVRQPHSEVELIAERSAVAPGATLTVALRLRMEPGWHVYWKNPGDSGMATSIEWTLPEGATPGPIQWPAPIRLDVGPLTSYGYESEVLLLTDIAIPDTAVAGAALPVEARADWLVCKEICLPASANLALTVRVGASPADEAHPRTVEFVQARERLPVRVREFSATAWRSGAEFVISLPRAAGAPPITQLAFFPDEDGVIVHAERQPLTTTASHYELRVRAAAPARDDATLAGVLVAEPGFDGARAVAVELPLGAPPAASSGSIAGLLASMLMALAGGLLLNLMPCVFPVLTIKVLGVVQRSQADSVRLKQHAVWFAAGVLLSFWTIAGALIALRAQGAGLGWGYQLQSPTIVAALAVLFFVLALNLSGVFQLGGGLQRLAGGVHARGPHADALLSGLLATVVAAPCTAPFMGAALGYALVQPALQAMLVFTALALGMAAPYVLLCCVPRLAQRLPRPGPWMETVKQLLAFPLYATVVWLVWVLGQQTGIDGAARLLAGLVGVAAGLWMLGRFDAVRGAARRWARGAGLALIIVSLGVAWTRAGDASPSASARDDWLPWSEQAVRAALAQGSPVFVDFTAAWCVTCQVNKRLVLDSQPVAQRFAALGVQRLRADWTRRDPAITAALTSLQRSGVPVYALYEPQRGAPTLLPEVLTRTLVLQALEAAAARGARTSAIMSTLKEERP